MKVRTSLIAFHFSVSFSNHLSPECETFQYLTRKFPHVGMTEVSAHKEFSDQSLLTASLPCCYNINHTGS